MVGLRKEEAAFCVTVLEGYHFGKHSDLGRKLLDCSEAERSEDEICEILHDVFSRKATKTLNTRSASLLAYGRWLRCISGMESCGVFAMSEELAYRYLCDLRRNNAAASKRKRFLEAVGFAKGLIGAEVDDILSSARVAGVAHGGFVERRGKKLPLTADQVITLENMATFSSGPIAVFCWIHLFPGSLQIEMVRWTALCE